MTTDRIAILEAELAACRTANERLRNQISEMESQDNFESPFDNTIEDDEPEEITDATQADTPNATEDSDYNPPATS